MKFLIDAQLPRSLARYLQSLGYDAVQVVDHSGEIHAYGMLRVNGVLGIIIARG